MTPKEYEYLALTFNNRRCVIIRAYDLGDNSLATMIGKVAMRVVRSRQADPCTCIFAVSTKKNFWDCYNYVTNTYEYMNCKTWQDAVREFIKS